MATENPTWGEERIANALKLKLGTRVSPRTVEKYLRIGGPPRTPDPKQRWLTLVHNHATTIVACDFFVVVTAASFMYSYHGARRIEQTFRRQQICPPKARRVPDLPGAHITT